MAPEAPDERGGIERRPGRRSSAHRNSSSARRVFGPTPHRRQIGSGARKSASCTGRHDHQAVRLAQVRGDLGHQLGRRHADRRGQLQLIGDGAPDGDGDGGRVTEERLGAGHVEERLVDRDRLDERREASQDGHHLAADRRVLAPVDGQEDARGHSAPAVRSGIAERTPKARAS